VQSTAYELLAPLRCQRLASCLFLSMRLAWMGMIVHITTTLVVAPLTGWPVSPLAAALVGATLLYCLGGFRAVVWTDVLQALILFTGAIITIGLIAHQVPANVIPMEWPALSLSLDPRVRVTLPWAVLSAACLGTSVKAGDQMNAQRFLSVPSVSAARRVLFIGFGCDVALTLLLGIVGVCLLAYYGTAANADGIFLSYISSELPSGARGLVVAALLAAAMSSLSSGINSCVSTVAVDWLRPNSGERFAVETRRVGTTTATVSLALIVFILSLLIGCVQGNLIELCYKIVNLLATPLGGLVLVALFIPRAGWPAAWLGCGASVAVVVWINYFSPFSFLVASPLALATQLSIAISGSRR